MDESDLIRAAQNGDLAAFNRLVLSYQTLAYNVSYRILGDGEAAADACQDAFLAAYRAVRHFRGSKDGSFKAWLLRIVTNSCYDQLRRLQRRPSDSLEDLMDDPDRNGLLASAAPGPEAQLLNRELERAISAGLNLLPTDQRTVLVLADVQGLDYQEVAQITRVSVGTVKSRLSRARARLRDYLRECGELLSDRYRLKE